MRKQRAGIKKLLISASSSVVWSGLCTVFDKKNVVKMEKQNHLNRLLGRRQKLLQLVNKITQSKDEDKENEEDETTSVKVKSTPSPKNKKSESTVSSEFLESINDTIEDSDIDDSRNDETSLSVRERELYLFGKTESSVFNSLSQSPVQEKDIKNIVVYSSSDTSDIINTSTVSLELSHSFFNDLSDTSTNFRVPGIDQIDSYICREPTQEPPKKQPKIIIISDEKVDILNNNQYLPNQSIQPTITVDHYEPEKEATYFNLCNVKDVKTTSDLLCNPCHDLNLTHAKTETSYLPNTSDVSRLNTSANLDVSGATDYATGTITIDTSSSNLHKDANSDVSGTKIEFSTAPVITSDISYANICNLQDPALKSHSSQPIADNTFSENVKSDDSSHNKTESWNRPGTSYDVTADWNQPGTSYDVTEDWNQPGTSRDYTVAADLQGSSNPVSSPDKHKSNSELKKRPKRKCKKGFKRAHIDFMSDDEFYSNFPENEDYSAGSSDEWSLSEVSDTSGKPQTKKNKRKKNITKQKAKPIESNEQEKTIKYKKDKPNNKRKIMKTKRVKGDAYETSSGKLKEAKKLQSNPCQPRKCPRQCYEILDERRQRIFDHFWNLDIQRKRDWLVHCALRVPIKRKKTDSTESKRQCTFEYFINEGEGRRQICQQFLLKTLDITQNFLLYTLYNAQEEGLSQKDKRSKPINNMKYEEATVNAAKEYIESLPLLPSHYCRHSSNRLYLPQEYKTLTNLYRLYRKSCEQKKINYLSERVFINLFHKEYSNITIHVPKKDKCNICAKHENNPKEAEKDKEKIKAHLEEKDATYQRFTSHQNYSVNKDTLVASFDLQKILNTPHGDNILLFYSRKYTVYNFTIYESSTQNGFCYVWGECDGKRGSKEIGSCLFKYLKDVDDRGIRKVILYCDACTGQNRNRTMLAILHYFLSISKNVETIQINFLLTGHSYMPVDSMHSVIEREVRKLTVWSYTQWPSYMECARKNPRPYVVTVMEHNDFIDWDPVTEKLFPQKTKDLQVTKIRIATIKKKDLKTIWTKHSMKEEAVVYVIKINEELAAKKIESNPERKTKRGKGKGKGTGKGKVKDKTSVRVPSPLVDSPGITVENNCIELRPLYNTRLPISLAKYKDLKKLCVNAMPSRFHQDYLKLPHCARVIDNLNQTDEEDNVDENNL